MPGNDLSAAASDRPNARLRVGRAILRLGSAAQALMDAWALGVMRPENILRFWADCFREQSGLYDAHFSEVLQWEAAIVKLIKSLAPGVRLLDVFCGGGREAAIFDAAAFEVTGVDYDSRLIELAREYAAARSLRARFVRGDFMNLELAERFDVVYFSPGMYGTFPGRARRVGLLKKAGRLLRSDGIAVISYGLEQRDTAAAIRYRIGKAAAFVTAGNREIQIGDRLTPSGFVHYFDAGEAEEETGEGGFEVVERCEGVWRNRFLVLKRRGTGEPGRS